MRFNAEELYYQHRSVIDELRKITSRHSRPLLERPESFDFYGESRKISEIRSMVSDYSDFLASASAVERAKAKGLELISLEKPELFQSQVSSKTASRYRDELSGLAEKFYRMHDDEIILNKLRNVLKSRVSGIRKKDGSVLFSIKGTGNAPHPDALHLGHFKSELVELASLHPSEFKPAQIPGALQDLESLSELVGEHVEGLTQAASKLPSYCKGNKKLEGFLTAHLVREAVHFTKLKNKISDSVSQFRNAASAKRFKR